MLTRNTFSIPDNIELEEQDGRGKKTAKPCVTSGTIIMFEKHFRQTSLFQLILVMLREDRNKTHK